MVGLRSNAAVTFPEVCLTLWICLIDIYTYTTLAKERLEGRQSDEQQSVFPGVHADVTQLAPNTSAQTSRL
jgi:hypothetical protein